MRQSEWNIVVSSELVLARTHLGISIESAAVLLQISKGELVELETNPIEVPIIKLRKVLEIYGINDSKRLGSLVKNI